MNHLLKVAAFVACLSVLGSAQISNVQFTDLSGTDYDLYTLLSEGKSVLVHAGGAN